MKSAGEVDSSWNRLRRNRFHMLLLQKLSAKVNGESSTAFYSKSAFRMNIGQVISGWFDSFRVWSTLICLLLRSLLRRLPPIRPRRSDPFLRFLLLPCRPSAPIGLRYRSSLRVAELMDTLYLDISTSKLTEVVNFKPLKNVFIIHTSSKIISKVLLVYFLKSPNKQNFTKSNISFARCSEACNMEALQLWGFIRQCRR